jgi:MoxR-like ATPase
MDHSHYVQQILALLRQAPATLPPVKIDEQKRRNAGRCMAALACHRLAQAGEPPQPVRHSIVSWKEGVIGLRNSRVADQFWTNLTPTVIQEFNSLAREQPVVYLFARWDVDEGTLHAWAVPEDVAFPAVAQLPTDPVYERKTVLISTDDHQLKNAPDAPSFAPYYIRAELTEGEVTKLVEAIKTDDNIKQVRHAPIDEQSGSDEAGASIIDDDDEDEEASPRYSDQTVEFLLELPSHVDDAKWHERNKQRYEYVLRDPSQAIVDQLRARYIQRLSPVVAGGKRHLSILKKNDYGKGGYHDHYWFAFYDPAAGSKTKSVQLFVRFLGGEGVWRYGLSMGNYCGEYMQHLLAAIAASRNAVADYVRRAPAETFVRLFDGDSMQQLLPAEFADRLPKDTDDTMGMDGTLTNITIVREYPLNTLPGHAETLIDEIGKYFVWAWPFFEAAVTGRWQTPGAVAPATESDDDDVGEPDETAPKTIRELAEQTALSEEFLSELEDALWAKQQAILVGPPGTSKTYVARQFARYFVRQRPGQPQGSFEVLYMHANWAYEDFFEGLKPSSKNGSLTFEPRLGFFLQWAGGLKDYDSKARHVLVLDEINRCDTAAVLGELLQLLEYRGMTVRLLSGRDFVFPKNLFIIGTMNSADRSIGRLDLALRRRFLWIDLHPRPETLDRWLKRPGNNPLRFDAAALVRCNQLLAEHDVPPEQQIGHALFMLQRTAEDDEATPKLDIPLSERPLRQIVRFSVLPYVRELLTMQFGHADTELLRQISEILLHCADGRPAASQPEPANVQPPA